MVQGGKNPLREVKVHQRVPLDILLGKRPLLSMIKQLIWNIRGIGRPSKQRSLCRYVWQYKPNIIGILEPFITCDINYWKLKMGCSQILVNGNNKIWVLIFNDIEVISTFSSTQFIHLHGKTGGKEFNTTVVYAKCNKVERREIWNSLIDSSYGNIPWIIAGGLQYHTLGVGKEREQI